MFRLSSLVGSVVDAAKSIFGGGGSSVSHSSSNTSNSETLYEPDKVKVSELENERMDKAVIAQKEIIKINTDMQLMIIESHQKGFEHSTEILKEMMLSLNNIAQERLVLIENGHYEVVEKIEKLYMGLEKEIREDSTSFNLDELPKMLEMLNNFPKDSSSARMYEKSIDKQIEMNMSFFSEKLTALHERQKLMVTSTIKSKELILEQSSQIVIDRMKFLDKQLDYQQTLKIEPNQAKYIASNEIEVKLIEE